MLIHKVGLAAIQNRKVLLVREHGMSVWFIPGGRIEHGEDHATALRREVREELGCELDASSMRLVDTFRDAAAGRPDTDVEISLYFASVKGSFAPCSEIAEIAWFNTTSEPSVLSAIVKNKIMPALKAVSLID